VLRYGPPDPRYAESKVRVEDDVAALADESFFAGVPAQCHPRFGFSPRLRADIVLNNLVGHAVLSGIVRVLSDGTPWRPLVHARDIATAFLIALESADQQDSLRCLQCRKPNRTISPSPKIAQSVVEVVPGAKLLITG